MKFAERVYTLCSKIPKGKVTTYKEISKALEVHAYQAVGGALKKNPYAPVVPCHRVVASDGSIGGFHGQTSGPMIQKKIDLLKSEGITVKDGKIINFEKKLHKF